MPAQTPLGKITNMSVYLFERLLPDPFVFAILLTMLTAVLAFLLAPHAAPGEILTAWYNGIFQIFQFAFQMVLILVTGYALSTSRPVAWLLARTARLPNTAGQAVALTMLVSMGANLLNWGFGLVVSALFARQIARRVRVDFAWLMAAAYAGFLMFPPGLSSSIALAEATPGSALNITQKITGQIVPLSQTLLPWFNILPTLLIIVVLPVVFTRSGPAEADVVPADTARLDAEDAERQRRGCIAGGLAGALDRAWLLNAAIVAAILTYVARALIQGSFHLDLNMLILIFLGAGLALHARPDRLCRGRAESRPRDRPAAAAIPVLRRHHGHHDRHRAGGRRRHAVRAGLHSRTRCRSGASSPRSSSTCSCPAAAGTGRCRAPSSCRPPRHCMCRRAWPPCRWPTASAWPT